MNGCRELVAFKKENDSVKVLNKSPMKYSRWGHSCCAIKN